MQKTMERRTEVRTCHQCGAKFSVFLSDMNAGAGKYCGRPCANLGRGYQGKLLRAMPGNATEISEKSVLNYDLVVQTLTRMLVNKLIHVEGLVPRPAEASKRHSVFVLHFALGPDPDPHAPTNQRQALYYQYDKKILAAMPGTKKQLEQRTGIDHATLVYHVDAMHAATPKKCYIKRWQKGKNGASMPVYHSGPGVDAPCTLAPLTGQERYRRYMDKIDRTGRREEWRKKHTEKKQYLTIRTTKGDPLLNALFGTPQDRKAKASQPNGGNNE